MPADFDLETFLPYRMNRASEAISRDFAQAYKRLYGMTRPEWRVLAALGQLGRLTATQIGRTRRCTRRRAGARCSGWRMGAG